jgi:hypothetical protein
MSQRPTLNKHETHTRSGGPGTYQSQFRPGIAFRQRLGSEAATVRSAHRSETATSKDFQHVTDRCPRHLQPEAANPNPAAAPSELQGRFSATSRRDPEIPNLYLRVMRIDRHPPQQA